MSKPGSRRRDRRCRIHRIRRGSGSAAAAVLVAVLMAGFASACGGDDRPAPIPADYHGVPVAAEKFNGAVPSGGPGSAVMATPLAELARQMENSLAGQLGSYQPVQPDCAASLVFDGTYKSFTCDAKWQNLSVPFQVSIEGNAKPYFTIASRQAKGLLTLDSVRRQWGRSGYGKVLSCDSTIPAAVLVPFDTPTPYRCVADGELYHVEIISDTTMLQQVAFDQG
ncbi:hypothetical protein ACFQ9X_40670 [Catenulispora yoronensis]